MPADWPVTGCGLAWDDAVADDDDDDDDVGGGGVRCRVTAKPAALPDPLRPCLGAGGGERMTPAGFAVTVAVADAVADDDAVALVLALQAEAAVSAATAAADVVAVEEARAGGLTAPKGCAVTVR